MPNAKAPFDTAGARTFDARARGATANLEAPEALGVVHDLGNLIQIATSAVSLMGRNHGATPVSDLPPLIASARLSLERAGILVRQIIGSARDGRSTAERVDITECVAEVGALVHNTLGPATRLYVWTSSDSLAVTANRLSLQNAILNLVFNARDAMPDGGAISISASEVIGGPFGAEVEICVADNGSGMTQDVIARVFDPYFTTKSCGIGGIGLPTVKRFAEEAGGGIGIASAPGMGTTVTIRLPAAMSLAPVPSSSLGYAIRADALSSADRL